MSWDLTQTGKSSLSNKVTGPLDGTDPDNSAMQLQFVASQFRFDPQGFEKEKPLRKHPFYSHPYLTCKYCNTLYFLDVSAIRYVEAQIEQKYREEELYSITTKPAVIPPNDILKPCDKCKRVDGFLAGALDATKDIAQHQRNIENQEEMERQSARKILNAYRRHLRRMYTRAIYIARTVRKNLKNKAATIISSIARGRLARRRYVTEKHLLNIRHSHPLLIRHALKIIPGQPKVFWYRRPIELQLVFADYVDFVQRTGFQPPRIIVERNIAELSRKITARKNELINLVQKRWRGFVARRIVRYFRTEIHRIFSHTVANAMKIQAAFRGHYVRRKVPQWRAIQFQKRLMQDYRRQHKLDAVKAQRQLAGEKARIAYQQERKEGRMGRFLDKIAYASELPESNVDKMKAMNANQLKKIGMLQEMDESPFGDDRYMLRDATVIAEDQKLVLNEAQRIQADIDRLAFIKARIAETGPLGYGLRSGVSTNPQMQSSLAKVMSMKKECSRSKAMRLYFQREFEAINQRAFERINTKQRSISIAPTPLPDMAAMDPLYVDPAQQQASTSTSLPPKKVSALGERLRSEFRLYNLSRLGDDALINRPGSVKTKKAPTSLLENVKVPLKKREGASRQGSRSAFSSPPGSSTHSSRVLDGNSSSARFFDDKDDDDNEEKHGGYYRSASAGKAPSADEFNNLLSRPYDDENEVKQSEEPLSPGGANINNNNSNFNNVPSPSKLRVRRFRTGEEADTKRKEGVLRSKLRAEKAAMLAKRPKYKNFAYPENVNFNPIGWLYEEDDDAIYG